MPTILSVSDIIELGKVTTYLAANYVDRGNLFGRTVIKPTPPTLITMSWYALEWGNDSGAETDASLRETANYCYWLYGKFQLEAQRIVNGSGGGGSVIPTPTGGSLPNPYDWIVGTITTADSPLKEGDTTITLDGTAGTRDFRGYNIEFSRGSANEHTTNPGDGTVYYSWNRTTGEFVLLNGAAQLGETMRISPVLGIATSAASSDQTTVTYNLTAATEIANLSNSNLVVTVIITPNGFDYTWASDFIFSDNWPTQPGATGVNTIQIYSFAQINSRWICIGQSLNIPT
jgi:hypothetical protein